MFFFNKDTWELLHLDNISREINILSYKKNSAYSFGKRHNISLLIKKKRKTFRADRRYVTSSQGMSEVGRSFVLSRNKKRKTRNAKLMGIPGTFSKVKH